MLEGKVIGRDEALDVYRPESGWIKFRCSMNGQISLPWWNPVQYCQVASPSRVCQISFDRQEQSVAVRLQMKVEMAIEGTVAGDGRRGFVESVTLFPELFAFEEEFTVDLQGVPCRILVQCQVQVAKIDALDECGEDRRFKLCANQQFVCVIPGSLL